MDKKTLFVKTSKGNDETTSKTSHLYGDIKRTLGLIDNKSTVGEISKRAAPSLRESLEEMLQALVDSGFIQEVDQGSTTLKISSPTHAINKSIKQVKEPGPTLDFTSAASTSEQSKIRQEETAREHAKAEAERLKAEQEAARISAELAAAEIKARQEAEAKARAEAEVERLKAEQEAARIRAERAAAEAKARAEAEAARLKAEQEAEKIRLEREAAQAKARAEAEAARLKIEREAERSRLEREAAQAKARAEAEAARLKAEQEADRIRLEREAAQAKARIEAEAAQIIADQEAAQAKAKKEAEAQARAEAEAVRLKVEQEAARNRAEQAAVEAKERAELEAARRKGEQEEAQIKTSAETARLAAEQEIARAVAEQQAVLAQLKMEAEAAAQAEADASAAQDRAQASVAAASAAEIEQQASSDEQARKLAQAQAKVWADAEQRAKAQAEQIRQGAEKSVAEKISQAPQTNSQHLVRKKRSPLPWGKMGISLFVLLLAAIFLLPFVWPMKTYIVKIEQHLSTLLQQKVHIGNLHVTLLPKQKIELQNVTMGDDNVVQADKITLTFRFSTLFSETKKISMAEIDKLTFSAQYFGESLTLLQTAGGDTHYPMARIAVQQAYASGVGTAFPAMNGAVDFDGRGNAVKAIFNSKDGKLGIEFKPQELGWRIALSIREGALPLLPQILFSELNLSGTLQEHTASFDEIDGYLYDGRMVGSAHLTWEKGWQVQGNLKVSNMELQKMLPQLGLTGKLDGESKFLLRGENPALLVSMPTLDGNFTIKDGVINKFDLVEIAQTFGRQGLSGGRTHFYELKGALLSATDGQHLRQIKISADGMSGKGSLDVVAGKQGSDKQLSGRLDVDVKMRTDVGSVPLFISGTIAAPAIRAGR